MRPKLSRTVAAVVAAALLASTAAQAQRTISVATLAPAGSTWMRGLEAANRELRRRTGGQVSLRFYPGGVQGDESEVIRKIRAGRLDGAVVTGVGLGQIHRPVLAFMLPDMFRNRAAMERSRRALASEVEQRFESQGFILASWGDSGQPRLFANRAVRTPDDLRQTRPWVWRDDVILPALYQEAHARGVPLALPEVLSALQTNRVDAVVAPPLACVALQWSSRLTHMSEGANSYGIGGIVFSRNVWQSLPEEQRNTARQVIDQFNQLIGRNVSRDDEAAIRSMTSRGMTAVTYTDAERAQWSQLFERTRRRLVGTIADQAWMDRVRNGR